MENKIKTLAVIVFSLGLILSASVMMMINMPIDVEIDTMEMREGQ